MAARSIYRLQLLLLALHFAVAALVWPTLPERVPIHFNLAGRPTAWVHTSVWSWFGLPLLAAATTLFVYGMSRLSARAPELWNVPNKQRFLSLSPAARAPIVRYLDRFMAWTAVLVSVTFAGVHLGVHQAATGRGSGLPWLSHLLIWGPIGVLLLLAVRMTRNAGEQVRQADPRETGMDGTAD